MARNESLNGSFEVLGARASALLSQMANEDADTEAVGSSGQAVTAGGLVAGGGGVDPWQEPLGQKPLGHASDSLKSLDATSALTQGTSLMFAGAPCYASTAPRPPRPLHPPLPKVDTRGDLKVDLRGDQQGDLKDESSSLGLGHGIAALGARQSRRSRCTSLRSRGRSECS